MAKSQKRQTPNEVLDRKRVARKLLNSVLISEFSHDAHYILDHEARFIYANPAAYGRLGYQEEELLRMTWWDVEKGVTKAQFKKLLKPNQTATFEATHFPKEGPAYPVEISIASLTLDGAIFLFASGRDITERKKSEQNLKALNETLEERAAQRAAVAEKRADMLRILTSELTYAEQRARRKLAQTLHDHLQQILVAAKLRVSALSTKPFDTGIQEIFREIDSQLAQSIEITRSLSTELSPSILFHAGLVPALQWLSREMEEKHGLAVKLDADESIRVEAEDIRILLFDSIRELLFNVVKHGGVDKAEVKVRTPRKNRIRITVSDKGKGFDTTHLDGATMAGFGLLSLQQRFELLGGVVEIESSKGAGAVIAVEAPLQKETVDSQNPSRPHESSSEQLHAIQGPIRVLLADDHEMVRNGIAELLNGEEQMEVVAQAPDGEKALALVAEAQPDVAILDIAMPIMNGIETAREIRRKWPHVRIIGLSSHDGKEMAQAMISAGASAFLTKGGPSEDLIQAVRGSEDRNQSD